MSLFVLRFEWSGAENLDEDAGRQIEADTLAAAKFEAAMAYAGDFKGDPPSGYYILDAAHQEAYRYPEPWRQRAPQG